MSDPTTSITTHPPSYIVGIGASAGGLEAIEDFFTHTPADSGLAFVVVQHLSPDYKSLMVELLSKKTAMAVHRAEDNMKVEANCVYLIPPKKQLTIFHGKLLLNDSPGSGRSLNLPIDIFLRSLADDQQDKAVAIILSGTGSDGMRGVRAVKENGGMVMVQDEKTAKFDGMPKSAVSTGLADFVLPPNQMPAQLLSFVRHPQAALAEKSELLMEGDDALTAVFSLLREKNKVDFSYYKPSTVVRRMERRMSINQISDLDEYVEILRKNPMELATLYSELLIGVTSFFRDPEAFKILEETYLPELLHHESNRELRIWVAGCSSGEEAYTLAMLCREVMDRVGIAREVKIFATDIDKDALAKASSGAFPESIAADLTPRLQAKYLNHSGENFQVSGKIRKMVIFAQHNLTEDPPFTSVDLVSCRNLLIYLQPIVQRRVLEIFNFSLRPGGILFLGSSETIGEMHNYFEPLHNHWRLFRALGQKEPLELNRQLLASRSNRLGRNLPNRYSSERQVTTNQEERILDRLIKLVAKEYVPPAVVVNEAHEVLFTIGDTSEVLTVPEGKMENDLTRMVHRDFSIPLSTGLNKVFTKNKEISYSFIRVRHKNGSRLYNLILKPLPQKKGQELLVAVFIQEVVEKDSSKPAEEVTENYDMDREAQQRISDLEQELQFTRENLQATVEELETSNEELQATNEELLASNEELQSTNEELQSVNEELYTVNAEHQHKIMELTELNSDVDNMLASSRIATIFLDEDLLVRKFTPMVTDIYKLINSDINRPFDHISHHIINCDPLALLEKVRADNQSRQQEVQLENGQWFLMFIHPYFISPKISSGYVLSFTDITTVKETQQALMRSEKNLQSIQENGRVGSWNLVLSTNTLHLSDAARKILHIKEQDFSGSFQDFLTMVHHDDRAALSKALNKARNKQEPIDIQYRVAKADRFQAWVHHLGYIRTDSQGVPVRMHGVLRDITEEKRTEFILKGIALAAPMGIFIIRNGKIQWCNPNAERLTGYSQRNLLGRSIADFFSSDQEQEKILNNVQKNKKDDQTLTVPVCWVNKEGNQVPLLLNTRAVDPDHIDDDQIFLALPLPKNDSLNMPQFCCTDTMKDAP